MKFIQASLLAVSLALFAGCQMQYEPLLFNNNTLETRTLDGAMSQHWQAEVEPIIQAQCIQCHSMGHPSETGLVFKPSALNNKHENLITLLMAFNQFSTVNISYESHGQLAETEQQVFEDFEIFAALYWNWQDEIILAQTQANDFFLNQIESSIVQPVCTGCHIFLGDEQQTFSGNLGFFEYYVEHHGELNSQQAMAFLIDRSDSELLYSKAIGRDHGGATTLRANSVEADKLLQHSQLIHEVIQLIDTQPY